MSSFTTICVSIDTNINEYNDTVLAIFTPIAKRLEQLTGATVSLSLDRSHHYTFDPDDDVWGDAE